MALDQLVSEALQADAKQAVESLQSLTALKEDDRGTPYVILKPAVIKHSKAVAFLTQTKAGVGIGVNVGSGFVVAKLDEAGTKWSAPTFITIKDISLGATLGLQILHSLVALKDLEAALKLANGEARLGTDLSVDVGDANAVLNHAEQTTDSFGNAIPQAELASLVGVTVNDVWGADGTVGASAKVYHVSDSFIVDASLKAGVVSIDKSKNAKVYGPGPGPAELLSGSVEAPAEFGPLFQALAAKLAA